MECFVEQTKYRGNHLFGIKLGDNIDLDKLKSEFTNNNVYVSFRGNYVRVASHLFNSKEDFEKLVYCFDKSLK
jgi:hypothetical protein